MEKKTIDDQELRMLTKINEVLDSGTIYSKALRTIVDFYYQELIKDSHHYCKTRTEPEKTKTPGKKSDGLSDEFQAFLMKQQDPANA